MIIFNSKPVMRNFLILIFFIPIFSQAQDTCKLKKETDPFTHQTKVSTGFIPFISNGIKLSISIDATSSEIDFFLWIQNESKCFDNTSTIQVNYEGERLKANFKNTGSMNCEGAFHFTFRNTIAPASNLERLASKKVSSIRMTGNGKTITDISFTEEQKIQLSRMASCVIKEAKTLIK